MTEIKSKKYFWTTTTTTACLSLLLIIGSQINFLDGHRMKSYPGSIQDIIKQMKTDDRSNHIRWESGQSRRIQSRSKIQDSEEEDSPEENEVISERVSINHWPQLLRRLPYPRPKLPQYTPLPWLDLDEIERTGGQLVLRSILPNYGPPPSPPPAQPPAPKPEPLRVFQPQATLPPLIYSYSYKPAQEIPQSTAVWSDYPSQPHPNLPLNSNVVDTVAFNSNLEDTRVAFKPNLQSNFFPADQVQASPKSSNFQTTSSMNPNSRLSHQVASSGSLKSYPQSNFQQIRSFEIHTNSNLPPPPRPPATNSGAAFTSQNFDPNFPLTNAFISASQKSSLNAPSSNNIYAHPNSPAVSTSSSATFMRQLLRPTPAWTSAAAASNYLMRPKPQFVSPSLNQQPIQIQKNFPAQSPPPVYSQYHQSSIHSYHDNKNNNDRGLSKPNPILMTAHHQKVYQTPPSNTATAENSNQMIHENEDGSAEFDFPKVVEYEHHYYVTPDNKIVPTDPRSHGNGQVMRPSNSYSTYHVQ